MDFLRRLGAAILLLVILPSTTAIHLDLNDTESIKQAASTVAYGLVSYYSGNYSGQTPGLLPYPPWYWFEAGAMFNSLINYWYYTGDSTYNEITKQGVLFQSIDAFMPTNQSFDEGNDDQVFWAFTAMTAAEYNFDNPGPDEPSWLSLAQAVFNVQAARWDYSTCGGGLRWQFNQLSSGWLLKTSAANGGFFNLAARLGAYTGNQTYLTWANRAYDWMTDIGIVDPTYIIYDNTDVQNNCTTLDHDHWTYTTGMILNGAAVMWNVTQDSLWQTRAMGIWNASIPIFFVNDPPMVMRELCEPVNQCNVDMVGYKGYFSRFIAASTKVAPWLYPYVIPYLQHSALAAAAQCDGYSNHTVCGYHWYLESDYDGTWGPGQQISALEVIQANLIQQVRAPVTSKTGGTSKSDPGASGSLGGSAAIYPTTGPSTSEKAGAGVLTAFLILITLGGAWWMIESSTKPVNLHARPTVKLTKPPPKA